ncbi:MAG: FecR family protein [Deltaproteobacteria bacterium]|nr:FecR family protein [Deltaproteobacteria bacterium]
MRVSEKISIYAVFGVLVLFAAVQAMAAGGASGLIPAGLVIENTFKPGLGAPVGSVLFVEGEALLIHADSKTGFRAAQGLPLFKSDTIITREAARLQFGLNDGSRMTLSSGTKLAITSSVYDPARNARSSFLDMSVGKARFLVSKLIGAGSLDFKVKTETSVCGVRGSDFIVVATPQATDVTALKETALEVGSLAYPDVKPIVLASYERTDVRKGELPSAVTRVSPEEIERMLDEFRVAPAGPAAEGAAPPVGILVPPEELVAPEFPVEAMEKGGPALPDFMKVELFKENVDNVIDQQNQISEQDHEQSVIDEINKMDLPGIPGTPQ